MAGTVSIARKSKATCMQCRARKVSAQSLIKHEGKRLSNKQVRCDGRPNFCRNCERLKFECSFQPKDAELSGEPSSADQSPNQPERRRGIRACVECRSQKTRCPGDLPTCGNCVRRNRRCIYPVLKRPSRGLPSSEFSHPRSSQEPDNVATPPPISGQ